MHDAPPYLEPLNREQRQAVLHTGKPLLILAGAGSGKTRVITTKIAWLIREQGMDPRSILAVTFTNKAAREMEQRARQIDERAAGAMLRTFHSFGAWFLRRYGSLAGKASLAGKDSLHYQGSGRLDSSFVIYDDNDVVSLLSSIMENSPKTEVKQFAHNISRAKDYFLSPDDSLLAKIDSKKRFRDTYARYEERMVQIGNVDFGDLIKKPVEILRSRPEVAQRFHDRFKVIMVDEYQDANVAQFLLLSELCGPQTYVCVVGDDDQSIYRFRGAEVKNILEFPERFSGADIIRLETNYRSTDPILKAASSVVNYNHGRLGKTLRAEKGNGPLPVLAYLHNQDDEAAYCADKIESSVKKEQTSWSDWAVLYRTNAQSLNFETRFLRRGIPYLVVGSLKFYEREEIKDALALLSLLVNPRDEVAFRRVVNKPARAVGPVTIDKVIEAAVSHDGNLLEAGRSVELAAKARAGLDGFISVIEKAKELLEYPRAEMHENLNDSPEGNQGIRVETKKTKPAGKKTKTAKKYQDIVSGEGLSVCVAQLVKDSGIAEYHRAEDDVTGNNRLSNLQELVNAASEYAPNKNGLLEFLEDIELDRSFEDSSANQKNAVTLITFHNTKGLEFKRVIMTGLEHGIFPREDKKGDDLEEERRLFYVGATRAMDELYLTNCAERRMYGRIMPAQPSLFLREIDRSYLQIDDRVSARQPPRSFNPFYFKKTAPKNSEVEKRAGYKRGQRIYHENYGYGAVMEVKDSENGPLVRVRFETGMENRFFSEQESRSYEKIGDDY